MVIKCEFVFENNPNATFYAGQSIWGIVKLDLEKPIDVKAITIKIKGYAYTSWCEESFGKSHSYSGYEKYISQPVGLVKPAKSSQCTIETGMHQYKFEFQLPDNCPTSLKSAHAEIRYYLKLKLIRPWKFNRTFSKDFTLLNSLDLNKEHSLLSQPIIVNMEKIFGFGLKSTAPLRLQVVQIIPITLTVNNETVVPIQTETSKVLVSKMQGIGVLTQCKKIFEYAFEVPATIPTCLNLCRVIKISYEIHIEAKVNGFHLNPILIVPITIGSVPLKEVTQKQLAIEQKELAANNKGVIFESSSASKIPPPSYKEATNMPVVQLEADNKFENSVKSFVCDKKNR